MTAKYEEAEENIPALPAVLEHVNNYYTTSMVHHFEVELLNRMQWKLTMVTPVHVLGYFLNRGVLFHADRMMGRKLVSRVPKYLRKYVDFFADLCAQGVYREKKLSLSVVQQHGDTWEKGVSFGLREYVLSFLADYSFQQFRPSLLAAAIVVASRRALNI